MIKKLSILMVWAIGAIYLSLPSSAPPNLPDSYRSQEPGDTYQHTDQKAFYTDIKRSHALGLLQGNFKIKAFGIKLPNFRLNYPPEETITLVREQLKSTYLEEIVNPFRESLFVTGWEPQNAPAYRHLQADKRPKITTNNRDYYAKVTLRWVYSPLWARLAIWSLVLVNVYFVYLSLRTSIFAKNKSKK